MPKLQPAGGRGLLAVLGLALLLRLQVSTGITGGTAGRHMSR